MEQNRKNSRINKDKSLFNYSSLGIEFAVIVIGFVFLGDYLDSSFLISPFGILSSLVFGFGLGIYYILYRLNN